MTRVATRSVVVPKTRHRVYLQRATNLVELMEAAQRAGNVDGVAVTGVQAAIALADAFTIEKLGLRSRAQDHFEVVRLVAGVDDASAARIAALLQWLLNKKSEVEYGEREVSRSDASQIARKVRDLYGMISTAHEEP